MTVTRVIPYLHPRRLLDLPSAAVEVATGVGVLYRSGLIAPIRPDRLLGIGLAMRYGLTPASGYAAAAARYPDLVGLVDDDGSMTFEEMDRAGDALAIAYAAQGVGPGTNAALLARNHRDFVLPLIGITRTGAGVVLLNPGSAGPQLAEIGQRENVIALVADEEFADRVPAGVTLLPSSVPVPAQRRRPRPPSSVGKIVVLTSGTTGTPKGAPRGVDGVGPGVSMLDAIPFRAREVTVLSSPAFHAWGIANLAIAMVMGSTVVLRRRFDPEQVLADIAEHRATTLAAVPVMLQRLLEVPAATREKYDTSSLRIVAISGSALPAQLATKFQDVFGDVIYNLYGSTEVGYATVARPADLRADPSTAGRVLRGVTVRLVDVDGVDVPQGESGRIFVGGEMTFDGYTGGADKARLDGLVSTGDTGRFDAEGRLFVEGRDDDMIVSGGENVFPGEVEDVIAAMPHVREVAVVGVPDEKYGQRLAAFVVRSGSSPGADAVRARVKEHLAGYKVPRDVEFLDELPRNTTGKVLRRELVGKMDG